MQDAAIRAEGLTKTFGEVHALGGVDLVVPTGTVFGLLGPNGAGKTTIVRILTTILVPDAGRATVLGLDVVEQAQQVREVIGLAGQYAAVDENLTGRENLRLMGRLTHQPKAAIGPRADELLERFSLTEAGNRPVKTYSGGMRRRLDLAASLVHRPPVLFLDEPTTGLDPRSRTELWEVIEDLVAQGTTLLLTTQYLEEADRLAQRIAVVDHGRIIAEGTAPELKAQIGTSIVRVELASAADAARAFEQLSVLGHVERSGDAAVELHSSEAARALVLVVRTLDGAGIEPAAMAVREPSLDDVFLTLTGAPAPSDQADQTEEARA